MTDVRNTNEEPDSKTQVPNFVQFIGSECWIFFDYYRSSNRINLAQFGH